MPVQDSQQRQDTQNRNNDIVENVSPVMIFNNNMLIAGVGFVPYVGWGYLIYVMWKTGVVVASYNQPWYFVFGNPFAWLELSVYSFVVIRSIKVVQLFKQRKTRFVDLDGKWLVRKTTGVYPEIAKTIAYGLIAVTLILLASAYIEYFLIVGKI